MGDYELQDILGCVFPLMAGLAVFNLVLAGFSGNAWALGNIPPELWAFTGVIWIAWPIWSRYFSRSADARDD